MLARDVEYKVRPTQDGVRTIYFHEDDYCHIELLPAENFEWCQSETRAIDAFAEAHRADIGWTDMYVRSGAPVPLRARSLRVEELRPLLSSILPPFDRVTTDYSPQTDDMPSTEAFGYENQVVMFVETRADTVSVIWLDLVPTSDESVKRSLEALALFSQWNLLLVDWGWSVVTLLSNSADIASYLEQRARVFAARSTQSAPPSPNWLQRLRRWFGAV